MSHDAPRALSRPGAPTRPALSLRYLDPEIVVVDKPPGMLVHRVDGRQDAPVVLQTVRDQVGRYLYPVHRLDRPASGLLAFALTKPGAKALQAALAAEDGRKEYLVLARGITPPSGVIDRPLKNRERGGVTQPARTDFERLATLGGMSLLRVRIHSGRHHQIRRHLSGAAHQVIGDTTHGKGRINREMRERHGLRRLFLHAWRLDIRHPDGQRRIRVRAPLAPDLRAFLLRWPEVEEALVERL